MKFYYTYVLQSKKDFKFYYGYTENLKLRIEQHAKGKVESTKYRRPLELIYFEACLNKDDALKREKYFKTLLWKNVSEESAAQFLFHRAGPVEFAKRVFHRTG
jgi:putative endonuclease